MRVAQFILATHWRPKLLAAVLGTMTRQLPAPGWTHGILVAGRPDDPGRLIVELCPQARYLSVDTDSALEKWRACVEAAHGELLMLSGDDDLQSPRRLQVATRAHEAGHPYSGSGAVLYYNTETGQGARWVGRGDWCGANLNMCRRTMLEANALPEPGLARNIDGKISYRIMRHTQAPFPDLAGELNDTVCLQHGANMWGRLWPEPGTTSRVGDYLVVGLSGDQLRARVPAETRAALDALSSSKPTAPQSIGYIVAVTSPVPGDTLRTLRAIDEVEPVEGWSREVVVVVDVEVCHDVWRAVEQLPNPPRIVPTRGLVPGQLFVQGWSYTTSPLLVPLVSGAVPSVHRDQYVVDDHKANHELDTYVSAATLRNYGGWPELTTGLDEAMRRRVQTIRAEVEAQRAGC